MKLTFTLALALAFCTAYSQNFKETKLKTEIKEVTVFLQGAQIFESGTTTIPAGNTIMRIGNLSPYVDDKSIQVKAQGDFTILSVNHRLNHLNELKKDARIDSLQKAIATVRQSVAEENARLEVLAEKLSLLNANKNLGGTNASVSMAQLRQAIDFYESEIAKIKSEEIRLRKSIEDARQYQGKLESQLRELTQERVLPSSEIEVRINAARQTTGEFQVSYLVANAGWYPKYDVRVQNIETPLKLTYKAEVYQNTGIDWQNVKLRFSNADPHQSGVMPELTTWNLNYARNTIIGRPGMVSAAIQQVKGRVTTEDGTPLPGVNVVVRGTSIGTVTDGGGNYSLTLPNGATQLVFSFIGMTSQTLPIDRSEINVRMKEEYSELSEVVVTGLQGRVAGVQASAAAPPAAKMVTTTVVENQTTFEIEVETPYSVKSNGEKLLVDLMENHIDALYEYQAIPKLEKEAFLTARITNWDQYNLLTGEANLYFEDAFVGRSILDAKALQDTLSISLGRDKNIVIAREKSEQFSRRRSIGSNVVETRGFKIVVRNQKSVPVRLRLVDQIPVPVVSDISVTPVELSKARHEAQTGLLTWELNVGPQQQQEVAFQYEVRYPKREKVILE